MAKIKENLLISVSMEISQAKPADLIEILYLLRVCILDMNNKGMKHWNSAYPGAELIKKDLESGHIFLLKDKRVCKGMVTLSEEEPEEYNQVSFNGPAKPLFMHRMAVHPRWQGMGIGKKMVAFSQEYAKLRGYDSLRLDVFTPAESARKLYESSEFKKMGTFQAGHQAIPYVCYEKKL